MRLREEEKGALKKALKDFRGEIYLFGSRLDVEKRGGDIDILLIPEEKISPLELEIEVKRRFFEECEEDIDVVIYRKGDPETSDTLRGRLLRLEKGRFISDVELYLKARILRNKIVHTYLPEELEELYEELVNTGKKLLGEVENLKKKEDFL